MTILQIIIVACFLGIQIWAMVEIFDKGSHEPRCRVLGLLMILPMITTIAVMVVMAVERDDVGKPKPVRYESAAIILEGRDTLYKKVH